RVELDQPSLDVMAAPVARDHRQEGAPLAGAYAHDPDRALGASVEQLSDPLLHADEPPLEPRPLLPSPLPALPVRHHGSAGSPAVQPAATGRTTPVIALAIGLARNTIALAISSASRIRPSGIRPFAARVKVSFSKNASVMGVTVKPGATAFTRTPCSAQSIASERVSAATAPLLAVYAACCGSETSAACEETLTTAPRPARRAPAKAWQAFSVPSTLISKLRRKSSGSSSSTGRFSVRTPAALTSTSRRSSRPAMRSSAARSVTST